MADRSWSPQQERAIKDVRAWMHDPDKQVYRMFGYAGTGKTTLALELANASRRRVMFGAFTGKASLVLRKKGCYGAQTIHSMIYKVDEDHNQKPVFKLDRASHVATAGLVIIDEVSMVDPVLGADLLSFGTKVLVLGDPAQLPPVKGAGFFMADKPDTMLTEVHRQARDNPIIQMSMLIRAGKYLEYGTYGTSRVIKREELGQKRVLEADQVLVGLNRTRQDNNAKIRKLKGRVDPMPEVGDKLVCLKNDKEYGLLNGGLWTVLAVGSTKGKLIQMSVVSEDSEVDDDQGVIVTVRREFFTGEEAKLETNDKRGTQEFTYGYSLTVHKSQGSQWDNIVVFDESGAFREDRFKHAYTAVTRAAETVTVVK